MRVAVLEDDAAQAATLATWLSEAGHAPHQFHRSRDLLREAARESFDAFLLDWNMPDLGGDEVLIWIRKQLPPSVAVLFVTARSAEADVVRVLDAGADDFLTKPVRRGELLARLNAALRRHGVRDRRDVIIEAPPYRLDPSTHGATIDGVPVALTQKEFEVAYFLFSHLGRLLSRGHLLESVWGRSGDIATRTIDTHVSRVRSKLRISAERGFRLVPVYSYGYRLESNTSQTE
jgi:DNA-binding response OmpR family regulator